MKTYLVGGAIRDQLLNRPVIERDWVVVGATAGDMLSAGYKQVGKDFPVFLHPQSSEEYALARKERKTAPGYAGFEFQSGSDVTLKEDLKRRDLTINAMAQADDGSIIDPYNGQKDLHNRLLRHVSSAFCEDPVRILRIARFAARYHYLGFRIAPETMKLMRKMVAKGEASALVPERIWKETHRALMEPNPSIFIHSLFECGALKVIFPEVFALYGVPQTACYHPEVDTGKHLELALDRGRELDADSTTMYAILNHDLGKGLTPKDVLPGHRGHEEAGVPLVKQVNERLKVPTEYARLAELVCQWHLHCHRALELKAKTIYKLLNALDIWRKPDRLERFLLACQADVQGREGLKDQPYPQRDYLSRCANAARHINIQELTAQGFFGKQLGEQIRLARLSAIDNERQQIKKTNKN